MATHDNSYKLLFSHAEMVRDLLLGFVKEEWVRGLDFSTLERVSSSYVSDDIRDRHDDIIWKVRWGRHWLYVYLLLEFQSTIDRYMPVRIMTYIGLLYQDLIRAGQAGADGRLPPVLPVVLYNGKPRWQFPVEISDLIEQVSGGLERYRPRLSFLLVDEGSYKEEELKPLKNLVSALFRLEKGQSAEQLMEVVTSLLHWLATPEQASLRRAFTVWFNRVLAPSGKGKQTGLKFEELTEVKTMLAETVKEWQQQWKKEGIEIGEKKGIEIGREEGRRQGQTSLLIKQLELKFGPLSDKVREKIYAADNETLSVWSERILTAHTLEEVIY